MSGEDSEESYWRHQSDNYTYILYFPLADALVGQATRSLVPVAEKTAYERGRAGISTSSECWEEC